MIEKIDHRNDQQEKELFEFGITYYPDKSERSLSKNP